MSLTPPHALTREQVEEISAWFHNPDVCNISWRVRELVDQLVASDAAMRQSMTLTASQVQQAASDAISQDREQQAQEVERLKVEVKNRREEVEKLVLEATHTYEVVIPDLREQLAAMTAEAEKYKALLLQSCTDNTEEYGVECKPECNSYGHEDDCPVSHPGLVFTALRQQLAASQQQVRELERPRFSLAECVVVDYLEKEVDQLLPMLGVEAALVTDLSHVGDFPDTQLGAEKYVWQAAIDLLRTQRAASQQQYNELTQEGGRAAFPANI